MSVLDIPRRAPAAGLTLDAQVVRSPTLAVDTAVVLGLRLGLRF